MRKISILSFALLFAANTQAQAPTVKAVPANRVTYYGANLNVLVNPNNDSTTISFEYGLDTAYGSTANVSGKYTGSTTLFKTLAITGLTPGKSYHYRAKAVNSSGTTYGADRVFSAGSSFSKSGGAYHTVAVGEDGIVYAFGYNAYGQLGDNTTTDRTTPIRVEKGAYSGTTYLGDNTNNPIISVSAGGLHSIALAADGSVYAFGENSVGQLGDNSTTNRTTPIKVAKGGYSGTTYLGDNTNNPIISVSAEYAHSMALAADGSVYAFGYNAYGQLGDNTTTDRTTPIRVAKGAYSGTTYLGDNTNNPIISVSAGGYHSMALAADGSVYAFGYNAIGQLGDNTTTDRTTPIRVAKGAYSGTTYLGDNVNNPIISVSAGLYHSIALAADGSVYAFGLNNFGQLGDNTTTNRTTPIQVLGVGGSGVLDLISCKSKVTLNITTCNSYTFKGNAITTSGVYYDTLTNAKGCDSAVTLNLTINNSTSNTITTTACNSYIFAGNPLTSSGVYYDTLTNAVNCDSVVTLNLTINNSTANTITKAACNSYMFAGNTLTSSGVYYDTLNNSTGCDSIITLNLTINTVNITVTQNNYILTASATNAAYQWLDCNNAYKPITGAANQIYTPTVNGDYAVIVTMNGCTDTSACININNTNIDYIYNTQYTVFPNPTNASLNIQSTKKLSNATIKLYNITGQIILQKTNLSGDNFTVDLSEYAKGIYILEISSSEGVERVKVVKE